MKKKAKKKEEAKPEMPICKEGKYAVTVEEKILYTAQHIRDLLIYWIKKQE